jgi:hypothetical protein
MSSNADSPSAQRSSERPQAEVNEEKAQGGERAKKQEQYSSKTTK